MSITTNLKFSLASPDVPSGDDEQGENESQDSIIIDPDTDDTAVPNTSAGGTTTTTTTTATTYYPNTGVNSNTDNNVKGTIFATVFFAVIVVALITSLLFRLKNRHQKAVVFEASSFHISPRRRLFAASALVLSLATLSGLAIANFRQENPTNAASETELSIRVAPADLTFSTAARGKTSTVENNIVVESDSADFDLYIMTNNAKFCLKNTTTCLNPVAGNFTDQSLSGLSTNQWGISLSGNNTAENIWGAVPTESIKIPHSGTSTTVYYGINLGNDLPDGEYTASVTYKAIAKATPEPEPEPTPEYETFKISYMPNDPTGIAVTGETTDTTVPYGTTSVTLNANGYTATGYTFNGWACGSDLATVKFVNQATTSISDLESCSSETSAGVRTVVLFAVWAEQPTPTADTMQGFDASTSITSIGSSTTLVDARDGKSYVVKRLPDGKVWMMQNLTIGMDGAKTLTAADTNIDDNKTYYLPPAGKQGSSTIDDASTLSATDAASFTDDSSTDQHAKTQFRTKDSSIINDSDTGYYNFYTATLGYSYYDDSISSGTSTRDICPKGWRLPKTTDDGATVSTIDTANDFTYLTRQYSTSDWGGTETSYNYQSTSSTALTSINVGAASPLAISTQNNYAGFSLAGYWNGSSANFVGTGGFYWSASVYGANNGYYLYFHSSDIYPQYYNDKSRGLPVRCIASQ